MKSTTCSRTPVFFVASPVTRYNGTTISASFVPNDRNDAMKLQQVQLQKTLQTSDKTVSGITLQLYHEKKIIIFVPFTKI